MSEAWEMILTIYVVGAIVWFIFSGIVYLMSDTWYDRRDSARCILATPVWPLSVLFFIWMGARAVWRSAFEK